MPPLRLTAPALTDLPNGPGSTLACLRRALLLSRGDPTVFLTRPLSLAMLLAAVALLLLIVLPNFRKKREEVFEEAQA